MKISYDTGLDVTQIQLTQCCQTRHVYLYFKTRQATWIFEIQIITRLSGLNLCRSFQSVLRKLYTEPTIGVSYQISVHLATRFLNRRIFINQPIRNKNCLWAFLVFDWLISKKSSLLKSLGQMNR
jgi:hypothetical protein